MDRLAAIHWLSERLVSRAAWVDTLASCGGVTHFPAYGKGFELGNPIMWIVYVKHPTPLILGRPWFRFHWGDTLFSRGVVTHTARQQTWRHHHPNWEKSTQFQCSISFFWWKHFSWHGFSFKMSQAWKRMWMSQGDLFIMRRHHMTIFFTYDKLFTLTH